MNIQILAAALIAGAVIMFIWFLRGVLVTPVPTDCAQSLTAVVKVEGGSCELERTVDGILWLAQNGTLPVRIVIVDAGMDEDTLEKARLLARDSSSVELCEAGEITDYI